MKRTTLLDKIVIGIWVSIAVVVLGYLACKDIEPMPVPIHSEFSEPAVEDIISTTTTTTTTVLTRPVIVNSEKPTTTTRKPTTTRTTHLSNNGGSNGGTVRARITHYCACRTCNGADNHWVENGKNYSGTVSGMVIYDGMSGNYCAASFGKMGDILTINGVQYKLVDRLGDNSGYKVDIFVAAGHDRCYELGKYYADVKIN